MNPTRLFPILLAISTLLCAVPALSQPAYRDFARHAILNSPSLSPDGRYLAVSYMGEEKGAGSGNYQLAVLSLPDLTPVSRLNMPQFYLPANIAWVGNERLVLAMAYQSGTREAPSLTGEIIALDLDGSRKSTLYTQRNASSTAALKSNLPDGFAYIDGLPDELDGTLRMAIMQGARRWEDGKSMLYQVDSRSGTGRLLGEITRSGMRFVVHDGVARYAYGTNDDLRQVVFVRDLDNASWEQLPDAVGAHLTPLRLTPDGSQLYALHGDGGGPDALVLATLDGQVVERLAADPFSSVTDVLWSPEPRKPYAAVTRGGRPKVTYLENNRLAQIHGAFSRQLPDHFVDFASVTPDGKRILVHTSSDRDPGNYALVDTETMSATPLYAYLPWISPDAMSERRAFRFTASDGLSLDGFLTVPKDSSGKNLPMVVIPHGGPIGPSDSWEFESDSQFLASRGYAVLQVNYRGSGGRGEGFERAGYKQFADGIQQDIIDATRWAIDGGYADKDRICIYGASFGGYSSLMAPIRAPGLYKCAINYVGISDYQIWFDRADTRRSQGGRNYFEQAIGTDPQTVKAVSPIHHLDRFDIPVFIVHGEDDQRVPVKNATELRSALDQAGKPYEWMVKPKEGHGFYSEANREELYQRMEAFLGKYIGG